MQQFIREIFIVHIYDSFQLTFGRDGHKVIIFFWKKITTLYIRNGR